MISPKKKYSSALILHASGDFKLSDMVQIIFEDIKSKVGHAEQNEIILFGFIHFMAGDNRV